MSADVTHNILFKGFQDSIEGVVDGLHLSATILDPKATPGTRLDKAFSLDIQTRNTNGYSDQPGLPVLVEDAVLVRVAFRLNPKNQVATQLTGFEEEAAIIRVVTGGDTFPLCKVLPYYVSTRRTVNNAREWLFVDIMFSCTFELSMVASEQ